MTTCEAEGKPVVDDAVVDDARVIERLTVRKVIAPLPKPHKTASGTVEAAPLVLLDIMTRDGVTGSSYLFVYTPMMLEPVASLLRAFGEIITAEIAEPGDITAQLSAKCRLVGNQGATGMSISAIDMALWDNKARATGQPLASCLGFSTRPVRVYDSLGQMSPDETAREVEQSLEAGFRCFKVKAGHENPATDVAVVRAIRAVAGDDCWIAMDFNQAFTPAESIARMQRLDGESVAWIEEPARAEDHYGHADVRRAIKTPVQTGENWWGIADMRHALAVGASDHVMPDLMKIGGVTGWQSAAALAMAEAKPVSSHLFCEYSVHLMTATPTALMLEWLDVAGIVNGNQPTISEGYAIPAPGDGAGLVWDESTIARYLVA